MNWGHGIIIGFGLFVAYILYFVFASYQQEMDLVSEDYYAQEVNYQDRIDQTENGLQWENEVQLEGVASGLQITFSESALAGLSQGTVKIFRPSDVKLDLTLPLTLDTAGQMTIPAQLIKQGRYEVQFFWETSNGPVYLKKDFYQE